MRWLYNAILIITTFSLAAQEDVKGIDKGRLSAKVVPGSSIDIKISYDLKQHSGDTILLKMLTFESSPIFSITVNDRLLERASTPPSKLETGAVVVPANGRLEIVYDVQQSTADESNLILPIVYPDVPASAASFDMFVASIELPVEYSIFEAFPTSSWEVEESGEHNVHTLTLQAVPSMIKLELGKGKKPLFSTLGVVDGIVILILAGLFTLGWKKIREV